MSGKQIQVKPGELKPYFPFSDLPPEYAIVAAHHATKKKLNDGDQLIGIGDTTDVDYYLIDGKVRTVDYNETEGQIIGGSKHREPLPQLRPSAYNIFANGRAQVIGVPKTIVKGVVEEAPVDAKLEEPPLDITQSREFFREFKVVLAENRVRLPTLSGSGGRIQRLVGGGAVTRDMLLHTVIVDPAITAKVFKMASSALMRGEQPLRNFPQVLDRLGKETTKELVLCYAYRDTYDDLVPALEERLISNVKRAQHVAAIAVVLAEMTSNIAAEDALIAGLFHNIGVLPIISYAVEYPPFAMKPELVDRAIRKISKDTGIEMIKRWQFDEDLLKVATHFDDWGYEAGGAPDLVSIVVAARYFYMLSTEGIRAVPKPREVPSLQQLVEGGIDPDTSLKILEQGKQVLKERFQHG